MEAYFLIFGSKWLESWDFAISPVGSHPLSLCLFLFTLPGSRQFFVFFLSLQGLALYASQMAPRAPPAVLHAPSPKLQPSRPFATVFHRTCLSCSSPSLVLNHLASYWLSTKDNFVPKEKYLETFWLSQMGFGGMVATNEFKTNVDAKD